MLVDAGLVLALVYQASLQYGKLSLHFCIAQA